MAGDLADLNNHLLVSFIIDLAETGDVESNTSESEYESDEEDEEMLNVD